MGTVIEYKDLKQKNMADNINIDFQSIPEDFQNEDEFYAKFKERLEDVENFPSEYMFKFIYPSSEETMKQVKTIFKDVNPSYDYKASKSRKYTSITVKYKAIDADEVIDFYKQVAKIKDVIML